MLCLLRDTHLPTAELQFFGNHEMEILVCSFAKQVIVKCSTRIRGESLAGVSTSSTSEPLTANHSFFPEAVLILLSQ